MITRRDLLRGTGFLSLSPIVPAFLARTAQAVGPEQNGRVLVVLQLDGGNDGINTVVPFGDPNYTKCRRELRLPTDKLFKIGDGLGLHPSMRAAADLLESGRLAIVQGGTPCSCPRRRNYCGSLPVLSRRSSTIWPSRSWPRACF